MFATALLTLALVGPAEIDPLAPAREGMAQCYTPNKAARTCRALATYEFHADGTITNSAEVLVNPAPLVVMHSAAPVFIRGEAECGDTDPESVDYRFEIDGRPADSPTSAQLRAAIVAAFDQLPDGEFCTVYVPNGDGFLTGVVTINGERWPEGDDTVLWVDPADGWKVAP